MSYAYADEQEPNRVDSAFVQEDVEFDPNVSASSIDPENIQANPLNEDINEYVFKELVNSNNFTSDRDFTAQVNFAVPLPTRNGFAGILKFGLKNRYKTKFRDMEVFEYEFDDDETLLRDYLDASYTKTVYNGGRYNIGTAFVDPLKARNFLNSSSIEGEKDFEEDAADYKANENVFAFYTMAQLQFGDRIQVLPGIRFERTNVKYTGYQVLFDEEGDYLSTLALPGKNTFNNFFPSLHANFRLTNNTVLRTAFSSTLARPNFVDLTPYQLILEEDSEIERGNPFLLPTTANNFDLMLEHYFNSIGVVSGGFFYKRLNNYIFPFTFEEDRDLNGSLETFEVVEPRNGEKATLYGFELAFQNRFTFLPNLSMASEFLPITLTSIQTPYCQVKM